MSGVPITTRDGWSLQTEAGEPVLVGAEFVGVNGDAYRINGGRPPAGRGKSGYVWTEDGAEFYPTVFKLRWVSPEGRYFGDGL